MSQSPSEIAREAAETFRQYRESEPHDMLATVIEAAILTAVAERDLQIEQLQEIIRMKTVIIEAWKYQVETLQDLVVKMEDSESSLKLQNAQLRQRLNHLRINP